MWSASITNLMNVSLKYAGILMAVVLAVRMAGGMDQIQMNLPMPHGLDFIDGVGPMTIVTWIIVLITVNLSLQSIIQISLGAKDVHTARKGFIIGGLLMLPIGFVSALLGVIASELYPNISATAALPQVIMSLDPWLAGITLAALWAATSAAPATSFSARRRCTPMTFTNASSTRICPTASISTSPVFPYSSSACLR